MAERLHSVELDAQYAEQVGYFDPTTLNPGSFDDFQAYCVAHDITFASPQDAVNAHGWAVAVYAEVLAADKGISVEELRRSPLGSTPTETSKEFAA